MFQQNLKDTSTSTKYWPPSKSEDYVRACTRQLKKVTTIYSFHKLVFERRQQT